MQPAPSGTVAFSGTGTVVQLPPGTDGGPVQLQLLQALKGVVTARSAQGVVTLQTALGPVSVQTGLTPPPGAQLNLVVQSMGPPVQVALQPGTNTAGSPSPTPAPGGQTAATGSGAQPQSVQTSLTQGSVLFATITRPAAVPAANAPGTTAATGSGAAATSATPGGSGPAASPAGTAAAPTSPATLAALPAGSRIAMRVLSVQVPGGPQASPAATPSPGAAVQATVTAAGSGGQTQIQSPVGQMTLGTSTPLPQGSQLRLEPVGLPQLPAADASAGEASGQRWDTLRDAIQAVLKAGPGAGQTRMMQAIPQPTPQMPAAVVFFLQALRHGSMRSWVGNDAAQALGRNSKPLLDRLGAEFGQMQRLAGEPVAPDWRLFMIPLFADGEAERLRLYVRDRDAGAGGQDGEQDADRFVVEANFSRLGPFQFDGLARPKRLDLMIRTLSRLPDQMQSDIGALFADTVTALGLTGSLSFQVTDRFDSPGGGPKPDQPGGVWA